ncbi:hypothetical protein [Enterococcus aquimarinus]|uniref:hypothetical protein n=1 Tax=Enterococcus aquimarinus TaxID=328396 RepID=UPI0009000528|nr:hypothetical protein [Enterococcus aquimarinus]
MVIKSVSGEIKAQVINDNLSYLENIAMKTGPKEIFDILADLQNKSPDGKEGVLLIKKWTLVLLGSSIKELARLWRLSIGARVRLFSN